MSVKQAIRYIVRLYQRWQYLRAPRPAFIPTVTPVQRTWSAIDERLERDLYLANPHAVWLRPDRNEHKVPCWQIEGFWEEPVVLIEGCAWEYCGPNPIKMPIIFGSRGEAERAVDAMQSQNAANMRALNQIDAYRQQCGLGSMLQSPHHALMNGLLNGAHQKCQGGRLF